MRSPIVPVILAGGSGTRLWPLSRRSYPKQFLKFTSGQSLLQETMQRVLALGVEQVFVLSNDAHYFLCQEHLKDFAVNVQYILEPCLRSTAPAIAAASHYLADKISPDAVLLFLPCDHWISDASVWVEAMNAADAYLQSAQALLAFGVKAVEPNTGYGYIEVSDALAPSVFKVKAFHEKPALSLAESYLEQGTYYWNSGILMAKASVILADLAEHAFDVYTHASQAVAMAAQHHDFLRLAEEPFSTCPSISIDYAVMEKTNRAVVMPLELAWSDLGSWTQVAAANVTDESGNSLHGLVIARDSYNCLISSENILVTTMGVHDQIIVVTPDAVLVADKAYAEQVKDLVQSFSREQEHLAQEHQRVYRPWGYYEVLLKGKDFKVKRLMVNAGCRLSLQMHRHRAEHWVVVGGEATVINHHRLIKLQANQSTYIPQNTQHRLSNEGSEPLFVIEVQTGTYLAEDDIIRLDDAYDRTLVFN